MEYHTGRLTITAEDIAAWTTLALRAICRQFMTIRPPLSLPFRSPGSRSQFYAAAVMEELATARTLLQQNQIRAAGAVAGVALEFHLKHVAAACQVTIGKHATIAQLQDALRYAGLLDNQQRKQIQKLADIRNLCVHGRKHAPSRAQVERLIQGVEELRRMLH